MRRLESNLSFNHAANKVLLYAVLVSGITGGYALLISSPAAAYAQECYPQQITKLLASDGTNDDSFGWSVSIDGDVALIGAPFDNDNGYLAGSAYVYRYDGANWVEEAKLMASDWGGYFGYSVSVSGDAALIGAKNGGDYDESGAAYVFRYDGVSWVEEARLIASDDWYDDWFGTSVSIDGNTALIGAPGEDDNGDWAGAAYIFRYDGINWNEDDKLLALDGQAEDSFGISVALVASTAVIGARGDDDNGDWSGSAYIFQDTGMGWLENAKLLASDGEAGDLFGGSVDINGDVVVVGAEREEDNGHWAGSAYVYRDDGMEWIEEDKLSASDGVADDYYGHSVAVEGDTILIGSYYDDDNGAESGSTYLYRYDHEILSWAEQDKMLAEDGGILFGVSVAISGDVALMGAVGDDENGPGAGAAYLFDLSCARLDVSPVPLIAGLNGVFTVTNVKPDTNTYLAYSLRGTGNVYVPFLNVTLDLDRPEQAGGTVVSDAAGNAQWVLHVPNAGAGRNVWFQACQFELKTNMVATRID